MFCHLVRQGLQNPHNRLEPRPRIRVLLASVRVVLFGPIDYAVALSIGPKFNAFKVGPVCLIAPMLEESGNVGFNVVARFVNVECLVAARHGGAPEVGNEDRFNFVLELVVVVRCRTDPERFAGRAFWEVKEEGVCAKDSDVNATVFPDVRIVPVRALGEH
ncbi:MAG: hypothetical protein KGZ49_06820 [Syntrophaceae bacterium]|nr:hypothetical protein [Syntrophaceae bacterium]